MSALLVAENIRKTYGGVTALNNVTLKINAGEVMCLAGTNGCGKSTLIKILSGVEKPDSGSIFIGEKEVTGQNALGAIQNGIQVIFQDMSVFPNLTVLENICFGERIASGNKITNPKLDRKKAAEVLDRLDVSIDLDAELKDLTVADRQIVAIARALVRDVRVLFMDEPTTALTWHEVQVLFSIVEKLRKNGVAIVFVSHKTDEVLSVSDRIVVMRNGEIVADAPTDQFDSDSLAFALLGYVTKEDRIVSDISPHAHEVLSVKDLSASRLFKDISFSVRSGVIVGITGLLGSGRSEVAEAIVGRIKTDSGDIEVDGSKITISNSTSALKAGIAYVPPDRLTQGVFLKQSIVNNIIASSLKAFSKVSGWVKWNAVHEAIQRQIENLNIKIGSPHDPVSSLSGGNQQKVVLAKCLSTHPKVLILNGPTVGVDIGAKSAIMEILRKHASEGMGIVLISDDIPEIVSVCHRVLVMRRGLVVDELDGDDVNIEKVGEVLQGE